jgi:hypothetical protein
MEIAKNSELFLRDAGYETWTWTGASPPITCFENQTIVGFIHLFETAESLIASWENVQALVLARHAAMLRNAGTKAWNVYSVFLTSDDEHDLRRNVERLEENFSLTRKIARSGIRVKEDLTQALLPLAPIKARPVLEDASVEDRVRARSKDISPKALQGFLGNASPKEIAELLRLGQ